MKKLTIQSAERADIPALQVIIGKTGLFPPEFLPSMLEDVIADPDTGIWLTCFDAKTLVGMCYATPEHMAENVWNMLALAVLPDQQGKGVGSALVGTLEDQLRKMQQRMLIVETSGTREFAQARGFYSSVGYEQEGCIRDYWSDGDDKIIFRKKTDLIQLKTSPLTNWGEAL